MKGKILGLGLLAGVTLVGAAHIYNALTEGRNLAYTPVLIKSRKIREELDGYKVAFITDVHHYPDDSLKKAIDELNRLDLDAVLIGGDFGGFSKIDRSMKIISKIKTKDGIYGVDGNHDNLERFKKNMAELDMHYLGNNGKMVREGLYICGVEDYSKRNPNIELALSGAKRDSFNILLCHKPDIAMERDVSGADMLMCGHTHGGEVSLFGRWAPLLELKIPNVICVTKYGQRFSGGWTCSLAGTPMYVSKGVGNHFVTRMYAQAEIVIFTLKHKS